MPPQGCASPAVAAVVELEGPGQAGAGPHAGGIGAPRLSRSVSSALLEEQARVRASPVEAALLTARPPHRVFRPPVGASFLVSDPRAGVLSCGVNPSLPRSLSEPVRSPPLVSPSEGRRPNPFPSTWLQLVGERGSRRRLGRGRRAPRSLLCLQLFPQVPSQWQPVTQV